MNDYKAPKGRNVSVLIDGKFHKGYVPYTEEERKMFVKAEEYRRIVVRYQRAKNSLLNNAKYGESYKRFKGGLK